MDRGAWQAIVHGVTKSQTRLTRLSMHADSGLSNFPAQQHSEDGEADAQRLPHSRVGVNMEMCILKKQMQE